MKTTRYSEPQILAILRQAGCGLPVADLCREHGINNASFHNQRAKYGGMGTSMVSEVKAMEEENRRLKGMYADLSMLTCLRKPLETSGRAIAETRDSPGSSGATGASIALVCRSLGVSETHSRYDPKVRAENEEIADLLTGLADARKTWGFGMYSLEFAT